MSHTLAEVAEKTGKSQANLRKMIERGQLEAVKEGGRQMVTDEALERMLGAEVLTDLADAVRVGDTGEVGNVIARLPHKILSAICEGAGSTKPAKAPNPAPFLKAIEGVPRQDAPENPTDDPHWGFKVGHKHVDGPRWKHETKNRWSLGDGWYEWNGFLWQGGGSRSGTVLDDGITPAHPDSHYRPLAPSPSHAK